MGLWALQRRPHPAWGTGNDRGEPSPSLSFLSHHGGFAPPRLSHPDGSVVKVKRCPRNCADRGVARQGQEQECQATSRACHFCTCIAAS